MKQICLLVFGMMALAHSLHAQKEDYIWYLGYYPNVPDAFFGGSKIDFHHSPPQISYFEIGARLSCVGMISSPEGAVQFYSNGCRIVNKDHSDMENGESINEGPVADVYCPGNGYPITEGIMALAHPTDKNMYSMLHIRHSKPSFPADLLETRIDMDANDGLGKVVSKDQIIFSDTLAAFLSAVRHGNGRDWWLLLPKNWSNRFWAFLYDEHGVQVSHAQDIGPVWDWRYWSGQSVFSPDGSLYARVNPFNGLQVFDFDRCTGMLSNPRHVDISELQPFACGLAFSPNSQYLYLSTASYLYQFDMSAPDMGGSGIFIDEYNGFLAPFPANFFNQRLAPDGKIYMASTNGTNVLHTIHAPDQKGTACDFRQHDVWLPAYKQYALPNFPNFRLYDLQGSPCDTLGVNGAPWTSAPQPLVRGGVGALVSPNPAVDLVQLTFGAPFSGLLQLSDGLGRVHIRRYINHVSEERLPVADLPRGLYFLHMQENSGRRETLKVMLTD